MSLSCLLGERGRRRRRRTVSLRVGRSRLSGRGLGGAGGGPTKEGPGWSRTATVTTSQVGEEGGGKAGRRNSCIESE